MLLVVLLVALISSQKKVVANSSIRPCITYDAGRTLDGFKKVILTWKDPFIKNQLWPAYASLANEILKTSKLETVRSFIVTPDSIGMTWLMNHTQEYENSYFLQDDFYNGARVNDNLEYRDVAGQKSNWAVLVYEDVSGMYAKIKCCNPEKPKNPKVFTMPTLPKVTPKIDSLIIKLKITKTIVFNFNNNNQNYGCHRVYTTYPNCNLSWVNRVDNYYGAEDYSPNYYEDYSPNYYDDCNQSYYASSIGFGPGGRGGYGGIMQRGGHQQQRGGSGNYNRGQQQNRGNYNRGQQQNRGNYDHGRGGDHHYQPHPRPQIQQRTMPRGIGGGSSRSGSGGIS